jgi:hypothetical protein
MFSVVLIDVLLYHLVVYLLNVLNDLPKLFMSSWKNNPTKEIYLLHSFWIAGIYILQNLKWEKIKFLFFPFYVWINLKINLLLNLFLIYDF